MSAPTRGFALMRQPAELAEAYDRSPFAKAMADYLPALRRAIAGLDRASYRGVGRYPLNASYDYVDPGWQWEKGARRSGEGFGRLAIEEMLGDWRVTGEEWMIDGPWLLPDLASVRHVLSFLERTDAYELVEVALHPESTQSEPLGFDVGYWASGNFSLICDSGIWPLWHPPPKEVFSLLAKLLAPLNRAGLFPDAESAASFRDAYRTQEWAEGESGNPFAIIQIARIERDGGA